MQQTIKQDFTAFYNANYTKINAHMRKKKSGLDPDKGYMYLYDIV